MSECLSLSVCLLVSLSLTLFIYMCVYQICVYRFGKLKKGTERVLLFDSASLAKSGGEAFGFSASSSSGGMAMATTSEVVRYLKFVRDDVHQSMTKLVRPKLTVVKLHLTQTNQVAVNKFYQFLLKVCIAFALYVCGV